MSHVRTPWTFGTPASDRDSTTFKLYGCDSVDGSVSLIAERNPKYGIGDGWKAVEIKSTRDR